LVRRRTRWCYLGMGWREVLLLGIWRQPSAFASWRTRFVPVRPPSLHSLIADPLRSLNDSLGNFAGNPAEHSLGIRHIYYTSRRCLRRCCVTGDAWRVCVFGTKQYIPIQREQG